MSSKKEIVFVIDPDEAIREGLTALLSTLAIPVQCYSGAAAFFAAIEGQSLDHGCFLLDGDLPAPGSLAFLKCLRNQGIELPVVVLASTSKAEITARALRAGAVDVIQKPLVKGQLLTRLQKLLSGSPGLLAGMPRLSMLDNGIQITVRGIRPDDREIEQRFVEGLSSRSKYLRFFGGIKRLSPYMLERFTHPCYPRNWALLATIEENGTDKAIGVARYDSRESETLGEFAIVVADEWQGLGIARHLLRELIAVADNAGIKRLMGFVLRENVKMLKLAKALGFTSTQCPNDAAIVQVTRDSVAADEEGPIANAVFGC